MKAYTIPIKKMFTAGLRPIETADSGGAYLTTSSNFKPSEGGLVTVDKLNSSFELNEIAQIFDLSVGVFILTPSILYSYSSGVVTTQLSGIPVGGRWSVADFGRYIIFSNGTVNLVRDPITGVFSIDYGVHVPVSAALCRLRGRLFLAGIKSGDYISDTNILWSEIGRTKFIDIDIKSSLYSATSGLYNASTIKSVKGALSLDNEKTYGVMVYGQEGLVFLKPATVGSGQAAVGVRVADAPGAFSQSSIIQISSDKHAYIGTDKVLRSVMLKGDSVAVDRIGYEEFFEEHNSLYLSYNSKDSEIVIGIPSENVFLYGNSFVLTKYGMGEISGFVNQILYSKNGELLVHMPKNILQYDALMSSDIIRFDYPGIKMIEQIDIHGELSGDVYVAVGTRADREADFVIDDWIPLNSVNSVKPIISGIEFIIYIAILNYKYSMIRSIDAVISYIDRRFMIGARSVYGNKDATESDI